MRLDDIKQ